MVSALHQLDMKNRIIILVVTIFCLIFSSLFANDTSNILAYDLFNSPDIIDINGEKFRIWSDVQFLNQKIVIIENWGEWIREGAEKDFFVRFVIEENSTGRTWDSGFFTGDFLISYYPEKKNILLIQKSQIIQKNEEQCCAYSYIIDFENYQILQFKHKRDVVRAGMNPDSSIWLDIRTFNEKSRQYVVQRMEILASKMEVYTSEP